MCPKISIGKPIVTSPFPLIHWFSIFKYLNEKGFHWMMMSQLMVFWSGFSFMNMHFLRKSGNQEMLLVKSFIPQKSSLISWFHFNEKISWYEIRNAKRCYSFSFKNHNIDLNFRPDINFLTQSTYHPKNTMMSQLGNNPNDMFAVLLQNMLISSVTLFFIRRILNNS